jgi:hypothetical protein
MRSRVIYWALVSFNSHCRWVPKLKQQLVLHPFFKLNYIKHAWGGEEEEAAEIQAGNLYAKNWQAEARKILEDTVRCIVISCKTLTNSK